MTKDDIIRMALDDLEYSQPFVRTKLESIDALRAALAQPEQEPVAWMFPDDLERFQTSETFAQAFSVACGSPTQGKTLPLYTAPPQREWQGLTYEEQETLVALSHSIRDAINRADWKLKEKNAC